MTLKDFVAKGLLSTIIASAKMKYIKILLTSVATTSRMIEGFFRGGGGGIDPSKGYFRLCLISFNS